MAILVIWGGLGEKNPRKLLVHMVTFKLLIEVLIIMIITKE